jgi:hypothetical protein
MSGRGGRRAGAGRPPGSKNQRTVEIARAAVEAGITPIEVMLNAMRDLWDQGTPESKREAATIAKDAAPYVHPRLSNIDQNINEAQPYAYVLEPCRTAEEWEAEVRADFEEATPPMTDRPAGSYLSLRKSGT